MRRSWLVPCTALLLCWSGLAGAQISDDVVKIGVLTDLSGPAARRRPAPGRCAAAQMAVEDFGGTVVGKPITVVSANHQIKPDIAAGIAREWYDRDQVDLIVDVPVSAVGLAVQEVANEKKKLFITQSTGTADFHGKFCSPYAMQWVFDTHALAVGTAQEVTKRGGNTWFFLTADYAFGHSLERDASQVDRAEWRQGARLGVASLRHAGSLLVHPPGAGVEGEDHRHRQRSARQRQRHQARRRVRRFQGRPADGRPAGADHRRQRARPARPRRGWCSPPRSIGTWTTRPAPGRSASSPRSTRCRRCGRPASIPR